MPIPSPADFRNRTKKHSEMREMLAQIAESAESKEGSTTKANEAKLNAIQIAASDATLKSDEARTAAKSYASDYTDTKFTDIKSYVDSLSYAANEVLLRAVFNDLINQIEELKAGENSWTDSLISTESGLTQRQLNNKFRSLKQFGADGNGIENDTVAIEAASEWMERTGGTVIVTSGDYYVLNAENSN